MSRHRYTNEEIESWRKDHHRAGYFNPADSRIFVPKGLGYGLTVNWGNPVTYLFVVAIVVIGVLAGLFFKK